MLVQDDTKPEAGVTEGEGARAALGPQFGTTLRRQSEAIPAPPSAGAGEAADGATGCAAGFGTPAGPAGAVGAVAGLTPVPPPASPWGTTRMARTNAIGATRTSARNVAGRAP